MSITMSGHGAAASVQPTAPGTPGAPTADPSRPQQAFEPILQQTQTPSNRGHETLDASRRLWQRWLIESPGRGPRTAAPLLPLPASTTPGQQPHIPTQGRIFPAMTPGGRISATPGLLQQRYTTPPNEPRHLGALAARFESGTDGSAAIGYDARGGTSYGTYQISSRAGTMDRFLKYLEERVPAWAHRLKAAGPANTGSRQGAMPEVWQAIASEAPARFARVQHEFIKQTHYQPATEEIAERTGVDMARQPKALQEVLWSTAVQHGPTGAANIFCQAIDTSGPRQGPAVARRLIASIYTARAQQFAPSTPEVQAAVQQRFHQEHASALHMLGDELAATPRRKTILG